MDIDTLMEQIKKIAQLEADATAKMHKNYDAYNTAKKEAWDLGEKRQQLEMELLKLARGEKS